MATSTRLAIGSSIVMSAMAYMAYLGASSSWQYYLTVDECLAHAPSLLQERIRISGNIAADSLRIAADRSGATFMLAGANGNLSVNCSGQLPDNLAEGKQVVVEGRLQNAGHLAGDKVLTRCASKYSSQTPTADTQRFTDGKGE